MSTQYDSTSEGEFEDVPLGDGQEQPDDKRDLESVDLGDETTPLLQGEKGSKASSKEDIIKKLAKLAGVKLLKKELEGLKSTGVAGANNQKDKAAQKIRDALVKKYGNYEIGNHVQSLLSPTAGSSVDAHTKYEQAIDRLILAEKLEKEASKSFSTLYKMAGEKKPKNINSSTIKSLDTKFQDNSGGGYATKRAGGFIYSYDSPENNIQEELAATQKTLEAKDLAKTLKGEAVQALSDNGNFTGFSTKNRQAEALLKGEGSLKKATNAARQEYLKAFYPVRYKLGQKLGRIASSISSFRRRTSSRGGPSTPKKTPAKKPPPSKGIVK